MSLEQSIQNLADAVNRVCGIATEDVIKGIEAMRNLASGVTTPSAVEQVEELASSGSTVEPAKEQAKPAVKKAKAKPAAEAVEESTESVPQDEPPKGKPYWDKTIRGLGKTLIEEQGIKAFVAVLATFAVPNVTKLMEGDESKFPEVQALLEKTLGKKLEDIAD